jgi:branched-subunit amino acid aminotransferase/4-amino-4-deoxychorismate lyase
MVWVNGQLLSGRGTGLSPLDRGFTLADGLFETMRAYDGVAFRLREHLTRLRAGARRLALALPEQLERDVFVALHAARDAGRGDANVRVTVSRGVGAPGVAPPADAEPTVVIAVAPLPSFSPSLYDDGISAILASGRRNERAMTAGLKTLAYTDNVVALAQARSAGADDALFLDTEGHLCEATSSNLFLAIDGALVTPAISCGALPGITRAAVLELARAAGDRVEERVVGPEELAAAEEAFLTSSVRELVPLVRVNGTRIGRGVPGPATRRLRAAYAQLVERERAADR